VLKKAFYWKRDVDLFEAVDEVVAVSCRKGRQFADLSLLALEAASVAAIALKSE